MDGYISERNEMFRDILSPDPKEVEELDREAPTPIAEVLRLASEAAETDPNAAAKVAAILINGTHSG